MYVKLNIAARSIHHCCHVKAIISIYSKNVPVASVIQHVMLMRRVILPSAACLAVQYFSTFSPKWHDLGKKYKMCFDFLYNFCLKHFSF
jgi:hypothetical protein